jgi:hypothetical protein
MMRIEPAHSAGVADRELLREVAAACRWWSTQRTWQVSSSHTGGGVIARLEELVARRVARDAIALALPSATTALITALRAAGIGPGSVVGVPALDWAAATAVAVTLGVRTRALPVSPDTGLLDTARLASEAALTDGLAAAIVIHLHGLTCDVPALRRAHPGLLIIEDAAQAWAARYPDGTAVGSAGQACVFSFGAARSPSAGELGCLVTRSPEIYRTAVMLTQHPTRQLLAGINCPRHDQAMTRVAPVVALLGGHTVQRHAAQEPALRQAGELLVSGLRAAGLLVLTDPRHHAPGVIAVAARPERVRAALRGITLGQTVRVQSVERPGLHVHADASDDRDLRKLAKTITTVTITGRHRARRRYRRKEEQNAAITHRVQHR